MRRWDTVLIAAVACIAVAIAAVLLMNYYQHPEALWRGIGSDRNGHFVTSIRFALAFEELNFRQVLNDIKGTTLYTPLHGLVLGLTLLIGGFDHRLGTIPSAIAWAATIVLIYKIARDMIDDPVEGRLAGAVAAIFALASPVPRYFAGDVMFESLGAAFTVLAIWLYMRARSNPGDLVRWRLFALAITALFYVKTNYWSLAAAGFALAFAMEQPADWRTRLRSLWTEFVAPGVAWLLRQPLLWLSAALAVLAIVSLVSGTRDLRLAGWTFRLSPGPLLANGWAIFMIWMIVILIRHRAYIRETFGTPVLILAWWHVLPISIWFLIPGQLLTYLWYVGPAHRFGEHHDPFNAMLHYWHGFMDGYAAAPWLGALALALTLIGAAKISSIKPTLRAPFYVSALCLVAVLLHPNHQSRFMMSWISAVWICAGVGGVVILRLLSPARRTVAAVVAVAALGIATIATTPSATAPTHAIQTPGPGEFDLANVYLPALGKEKHVGALIADGDRFHFFVWAATMHCHCRIAIDHFDHGGPALSDELGQSLQRWLETTNATRLMAVSSPEYPISIDALKTLAQASGRFKLSSEQQVASHRATVAVWERTR